MIKVFEKCYHHDYKKVKTEIGSKYVKTRDDIIIIAKPTALISLPFIVKGQKILLNITAILIIARHDLNKIEKALH